jgi:hypothetical protein
MRFLMELMPLALRYYFSMAEIFARPDYLDSYAGGSVSIW